METLKDKLAYAKFAHMNAIKGDPALKETFNELLKAVRSAEELSEHKMDKLVTKVTAFVL